eukprot:TRINITY_DN3836_c0_g1_i5.p1 TRINITY_DN3836_c0_g1~~TRINITY_DN3836_c0_g1_i5.p1  ORF type:complete len:149 (-),score=33.62 TRINITY_DN3836_c0_g1_i5:120-566(-)
MQGAILGLSTLIGLASSQANYRPGTGGGPGGSFSFPGAGGFPGGVGGPAGVGSVDDLTETIPGTPGDDYPIYGQVPETSFLCDGQVDGGYYGDPEAECQAFHICAADGVGGLTKYSFLAPMAHFSNNSILYVTGGSMLIVQLLKISIL